MLCGRHAIWSARNFAVTSRAATKTNFIQLKEEKVSEGVDLGPYLGYNARFPDEDPLTVSDSMRLRMKIKKNWRLANYYRWRNKELYFLHVPEWLLAWHKIEFWMCEYRELGLLHDDFYYEDVDSVAKEAYRRLPPDLQWARQKRMARAFTLSMKHRILPQKDWTKFEDDVPYLYPYLEEVKRENAESKAWDSAEPQGLA